MIHRERCLIDWLLEQSWQVVRIFGMILFMSRRLIITIITVVGIGVVAAIAILLAKGYTFSPKEKRIIGTGIITISSEPDAASVFIDGHLTTATNATVSSLVPKTYSVKLAKEGFIPWVKSVAVKEGLVTELKVTLFPSLPTIYPLTFNGVANPTLSPDGSKLAYLVPAGKKGGVWVWTMSKNQPIAFARSSEPHQIASNTSIDFSKAKFKWSPDSKQVLASIDQGSFLLDSERLNSDPKDITAILQATLTSWEDDTKDKEALRIETIKDKNLRKVASDSATLVWSPDETKFMARLPDGQANMKVYDLDEGSEYSLSSAKAHIWLPDSRHIILVESSTISVADFDGSNIAVIYAGNFQDTKAFPWPDSSKLVIISSFPTPTAAEPNLYGINLK